jgi:O-antigen/teichoic acid export membrane protein
MDHPSTPPSPRIPRALYESGTAYMIVGTLVAAIAAYGFQLVAGRDLGPAAFAPITVLWTIQFLVFTTVFIPMEQLTIRRLSAAMPSGGPWRLFAGVIAISALLAIGFASITRDRLLAGNWIYVGILAILVTSYGGFALGRGVLAGRRRFREYGLSTLAESLLRLALAIGVLAAGVGAVGVAWTMVAGPFVVYLWRPFHTEPRRGTVPVGPGSAQDLAAFVAANAASQTIVAAGPLVVGALGAGPAEVSVFFETFLLFRAPLTLAYGLIARVLPPFTRMVEAGEGAILRRWAGRIAAIAAAAAGAGYVFGRWAGPGAVAVLLGAEYRPGATIAGYAAAGVAIATIALFAQQILIAQRATGALAASWFGGLMASALIVVTASGSPSARVGAAFLGGEILAFALIVISVTAVSRRS